MTALKKALDKSHRDFYYVNMGKAAVDIPIQLYEDHRASDWKVGVDREAAVIKGVKVLGPNSRNGYGYSDTARQQARQLYEGIKVNLNHPANHPNQPRTVQERYGRLVNLRESESGVFADLRYNPKDAMTEKILWWAENDPAMIGLSHNADGIERKRNGKTIIESIVRVRSVDLVVDPATTSTLYEQTGGYMAADETNPAEGAMPEDMKPEEAAAPKAGDKLAEALTEMIMDVVKDKGLDIDGKLEKIRGFLEMQENALGGEAAVEEQVKQKTVPADPSIKALLEQVSDLRRRDRARELCDAADVKPSSSMLKALTRLDDEKDVKALIEEWKGKAAVPPAPKAEKVQSQSTQDKLLLEQLQNRNNSLASLEGDDLVNYLRN